MFKNLKKTNRNLSKMKKKLIKFLYKNDKIESHEKLYLKILFILLIFVISPSFRSF